MSKIPKKKYGKTKTINKVKYSKALSTKRLRNARAKQKELKQKGFHTRRFHSNSGYHVYARANPYKKKKR